MQLGCLILTLLGASIAQAHPSQVPILQDDDGISARLFTELEELARIVDISYCVGMTGLGIYKPFRCASRCSEFPDFELVQAWNTGPLLSDSCGYVALSHPPSPKRVIVAFRGTYSLSNTIADLSTVPQEYIPYPGSDDDSHDAIHHSPDDSVPPTDPDKCTNCTVHSGFYRSWLNTRTAILTTLSETLHQHPDYQLSIVGHSLGGAVALLGALDLKARGWDPTVTTFGEPRVGNGAFTRYIDAQFHLPASNDSAYQPASKLRRVTHAHDPVPLLPLEEWGFGAHGGEIFIAKPDLPPDVPDIRHCRGDADRGCIAGGSGDLEPERDGGWMDPGRFRPWQLFFAHRDYFWRLGLCVPGGDPWDWYRKYPHRGDG